MNRYEQVYAVVRQIPFGRVTTYGQIARLLGEPRLARIVGCALYQAPAGLPCHRVVNRQGGLCEFFSPAGRESHRLLLEAEGVPFTARGNVDLARCFWAGEGLGALEYDGAI